MTDPIQDLTHDHADINRRVLAIGAAIRALDRDGGNGLARALVGRLGELRELLFTHFAREEEGLFPFVTDAVSALTASIAEMATAHDAICGALARVYHLAESNADIASITHMYTRFEAAYASHSEAEGRLLQQLGHVLDPAQRDQLSGLVRGL
ncbi:MAG TPA: hemerythrin domain-containing protein [Kofleriaceae bacterium]|nr:hemerythrin domain-containing protein [Kofleriaceae bacterium]